MGGLLPDGCTTVREAIEWAALQYLNQAYYDALKGDSDAYTNDAFCLLRRAIGHLAHRPYRLYQRPTRAFCRVRRGDAWHFREWYYSDRAPEWKRVAKRDVGGSDDPPFA